MPEGIQYRVQLMTGLYGCAWGHSMPCMVILLMYLEVGFPDFRGTQEPLGYCRLYCWLRHSHWLHRDVGLPHHHAWCYLLKGPVRHHVMIVGLKMAAVPAIWARFISLGLRAHGHDVKLQRLSALVRKAERQRGEASPAAIHLEDVKVPDCKLTVSCFTEQNLRPKEGGRCNLFISIGSDIIFELVVNIIILKPNTLSYVQPCHDVELPYFFFQKRGCTNY